MDVERDFNPDFGFSYGFRTVARECRVSRYYRPAFIRYCTFSKILEKRKENKLLRLNVNAYRSILNENQITDEEVRKAIGMSRKTYDWIISNGFAEYSTLDRLADAIGCDIQMITLPDPVSNQENVIEFVRDGKYATVSLSQGRYIGRIRKLAESHPGECQIVAENIDGSICARVPVNWVKINPGPTLSEEQRKERADMMRKYLLKSDSDR